MPTLTPPSSSPSIPPPPPPQAMRALHNTSLEGVPRPMIVKLADDKGDHNKERGGGRQQVRRGAGMGKEGGREF